MEVNLCDTEQYRIGGLLDDIPAVVAELTGDHAPNRYMILPPKECCARVRFPPVEVSRKC